MTITPSPLAQQEQEAETIRQQACDVFVASLRDYAARGDWLEVIDGLRWAYIRTIKYAGIRLVLSEQIVQFADGYGWPDTLRALAQALEADEQFQREAERRR